MWIGSVSLEELSAADRWIVGYFSAETKTHEAAFPLYPLRTLVSERKSTVDPQGMQEPEVNYIGLEHIRSVTGELVDFCPRAPSDVKSRSKTFEVGDVLYGRLRPELNKVYLAEPDISPGICSNEFIVLRADRNKILPLYLRYALASPYVSQFASKLRTGASLPRLNSGDLLDLSIPVPPIPVQEELSSTLSRLDGHLRRLRHVVEWLPEAILSGLASSLREGRNRLDDTESKLRKLTE